MVPGQPSQPGAVWTETGSGIEVAARDQHFRGAATQGQSGQGVDRLIATRRVALVDADEPATGGINHEVGVAEASDGVSLRSQGAGLIVRLMPVQPLVVKVGEVNDSASHGEVAFAVLMDPGAHVEGPGSHVLGLTAGGAAYDDPPSSLRGPCLQPINVAAVQGNAAKPHRIGHDGLGGDGRFPGTVWGCCCHSCYLPWIMGRQMLSQQWLPQLLAPRATEREHPVAFPATRPFSRQRSNRPSTSSPLSLRERGRG